MSYSSFLNGEILLNKLLPCIYLQVYNGVSLPSHFFLKKNSIDVLHKDANFHLLRLLHDFSHSPFFHVFPYSCLVSVQYYTHFYEISYLPSYRVFFYCNAFVVVVTICTSRSILISECVREAIELCGTGY